jgi:hypothetical protein
MRSWYLHNTVPRPCHEGAAWAQLGWGPAAAAGAPAWEWAVGCGLWSCVLCLCLIMSYDLSPWRLEPLLQSSMSAMRAMELSLAGLDELLRVLG